MLFQHIPNPIQPAFCKNLLCNCLFRPGIAKRFKIRRIEVAILEWDALIFRKQLHSYWAAEAAEAFIMNFFRPGCVFLHMGFKCWKRSKKIQLPLLLCDVMRSRFLIITETKTETPNSWDRWEGRLYQVLLSAPGFYPQDHQTDSRPPSHEGCQTKVVVE